MDSVSSRVSEVAAESDFMVLITLVKREQEKSLLHEPFTGAAAAVGVHSLA